MSITLPNIGEVTKENVKEWLRSPKNILLLLWMIAVVISGAILFLCVVNAITTDKDLYFEVNNQILNVLFVAITLYVHPTRTLHLFYLIRNSPEDVLKLRAYFCKNGTEKPNERKHILVIVILQQLNCFATYALAGINWLLRRGHRPDYAIALCLSVAIGAGFAAEVYKFLSPLGKESEVVQPEVAQPEVHRMETHSN